MWGIADVSSWAFGWNALVALGTIFLAVVTLGVVVYAARQVKATGRDIAAQDRPVLVPSESPSLTYDSARLQPAIRNAGKGVALDVQALLEWRTYSRAAETWNKAALSPGASAILTFEVPMLEADFLILRLQYRDIANSVHTSDIVIDRNGSGDSGGLRYADTIIDTSRPVPALSGRGIGADETGASEALVTEWIKSKVRKRRRHWVLDE